MHMSKICSTFAAQKVEIMEQYMYSTEELRESVEEGTRQVERGQYYTDAQVNWMLEQRNRQLA